MQLHNFEEKIQKNKIEELLKDETAHFLELLALNEDLEYLSLSYFDYEYNEFFFNKAVNNQAQEIQENKDFDNEFVLKHGDVILALLKSSKALSASSLSENLILKLISTIKKTKRFKEKFTRRGFFI